MKYTSERKDKADRQMTKATRRFKQNTAKNKGDYGDVPAAYAAAPRGATYDHEMLSGSGGLNEMDQLLFALLEEAKQQIPNLKCAVCGGEHHPAAKHTARALAPENNIQEGSMPLHKAKRSLEAKGFKHTGTKGQVHSYAHSDGRKAQIQQSTVHDCPNCGSDKHLNFSDYDFGRDSQTGYHDAGGRFHCTKCGTKGDAEDAQNHRGKIVSEGLGPVVNGKQKPITPYAGSWADQEAKRKAANPGKVHPLAKPMYPGATTLPGKYDRYGNKIAEGEKPTPDEMLKATLCKKTPNGKEVLDELGESGLIEGKKNKGPKWDGNSLTIKSGPEDIRRKAAAVIGQPPPKQVIKSKKDKQDKYKKDWRKMDESHEEILKAHGYKPTESFDSDWKRYEHKDTSHVNVKANGDWEHKGKDKSRVATKGDSENSLKRHLAGISSRARSTANRKDRDDAMRSLGLTKVKGARGGTYWESETFGEATSGRPPLDPADTPATFQAANNAIVGTQDKVVGVKEVEGFPQSSNLKAIKRRNAGNSLWAKIKKGSAF